MPAEFASVVDAVRCAVAVQQAMVGPGRRSAPAARSLRPHVVRHPGGAALGGIEDKDAVDIAPPARLMLPGLTELARQRVVNKHRTPRTFHGHHLCTMRRRMNAARAGSAGAGGSGKPSLLPPSERGWAGLALVS
jgi:hypothetical protein